MKIEDYAVVLYPPSSVRNRRIAWIITRAADTKAVSRAVEP
jgi:hypothetical protein